MLVSQSDMRHLTPLLILFLLSAISRVAIAVSDDGQNLLTQPTPIYIRLFKEERTLEVWQQSETGHYRLQKTYPICNYSGLTGPKLVEGDRQSPEGFYLITPDQMRPDSRYHLALDIGFPNEYDQTQGYTGSALMIHGDCVSKGCYAMTDAYIEEIYAIVDSAFSAGQREIPLHIFPFRMNDMNMEYYSRSPWIGFWQQLRKGYLLFEKNSYPPLVEIMNGQYITSSGMARQLVAFTKQPDSSIESH